MTEPGFSAGGGELRTSKLFAAVHERVSRSSLTTIEGTRRPPWSPPRLAAVARGTPPRLTQLCGGHTIQKVNDVVAGAGMTVVSTTFTAALVDREKLGSVVLDAHNLEWRVNQQLARSSDGIIRKSAYGITTDWVKRFESNLARSVAGVWAVSSLEAEWFASMGAATWVVRNGVDLPASAPPPSGTHDILFVGSLNSRFNRQGIEWFCRSVLPLVRAEIKDARLDIVGSGPLIEPVQGAVQHGFAEDLSPFYAKARVCIAPLLAGAGTRLKVPEAMANACPVVSTAIGAEGLDLSFSDGVSIADNAVDFARACIGILADDEEAAVRGAKARAKAIEFSWDRIAAVAAQSLRELGVT